MKNSIINLGVCLLFTVLVKDIVADGVVSFNVQDERKISNTLEITCPNNLTRCLNGQTCCITKHGIFHCCRYKNAVCCPDKYHCCPEGTSCDADGKRCSQSLDKSPIAPETPNEPMEWPVVNKSEIPDVSFQMCPNNRTKCQNSQTCCLTKHGSYHCCKFENAVCCSDKFHCCPEDSTCDLNQHRCIQSNNKMLKLHPSNTLMASEQRLHNRENTVKEKSEITCPNNKTKCKDTKTCCITKHGNYYCCPHKNAVCCSDKWLCCPEGTTCDVKNKKCIGALTKINVNYKSSAWNMDEPSFLKPAVFDFFTAFLAGDKLEKKCPNTAFSCPGTKKCCAMLSGKFGCCNFNKGVCCQDMKTCCPHGTECDTVNGKCSSKASGLVPVNIENKGKVQIETSTMCPDKNIECKDFETCCSVGYDSYGCCPFKNATCCSDKASCCPHNKKCDLAKKMCIKQEELKSIETSKTVERKSLISYFSGLGLKNICPDRNRCEGNQTCCLISDTSYGCCPFDFGICCSDMKTCCMQGYKCVEGGCQQNPS